MPMQCESRPDLKESTQRVIDDSWAAHQAGGGSLPLDRFLSVLGNISQADRAKLTARGAIVLTPGSDHGGRFVNEGEADIKIKWEGSTLKIPRSLHGDYVSFQDECHYIFDSGAQIVGCRFIFCVAVERVLCTKNRLSVDLEGESFDLCYIF
jgi:hypothetical protein